MKRPGAFMLIFGIYLILFVVFKDEARIKLLPNGLEDIDTLSDLLMLKFGAVIALFGLVAVLASSLGNAARRVRKGLGPGGTST